MVTLYMSFYNYSRQLDSLTKMGICAYFMAI